MFLAAVKVGWDMGVVCCDGASFDVCTDVAGVNCGVVFVGKGGAVGRCPVLKLLAFVLAAA